MSIQPVSIPYSTDRECSLCQMNPFEEDKTIISHSWNGHSVRVGKGEDERNVIHGICAKCLKTELYDKRFLKCFECRMSFPHGRRSEIIIRRDGTLIRETLLPPIKNQDILHDFGGAFPTGSCSFFAIAGTAFIGFLAAELVASSAKTTFLIPGAHLAVRMTNWTPTTLVAAATAPVMLSLSLSALALGMLACLGDAFIVQRRQRDRPGI